MTFVSARVQCGPEGHRNAKTWEPKVPEGRIAFFGNRICPFAARGWTALLANGFNVVPATAENEASSREDDVLYYHVDLGADKPAWYKEKVSENATVPVVVDNRKGEMTLVDGSDTVVAFARENKRAENGPAATAAENEDAAKATLASIGPSYRLLKAHAGTDRDDVLKHLAECTEAYDALEKAYASSSGPFLFDSDVISEADVMILPFVDRFAATLDHYRAFPVLQGRPALTRALRLAQAGAMQIVSQTAAFYIWGYRSYALTADDVEALKKADTENLLDTSSPPAEKKEDAE